MKFEIAVQFSFEASHTLPNHKKCSRMHGHSFKGTVFLEANKLNDDGMVLDFDIVEKRLYEVRHSHLDHFHLNESLGMDSPTCENITKWLWDYLKPKLPSLKSVEISETGSCRARYSP